MENRLKERLTGAAILVALVVMLVPEMFHGQRGDSAAGPGSSGDGPPVRSYTIDLSNSPASTAPLQSTPVNAGAPGAPGAASGNDQPAVAPPPVPAVAPPPVPAAAPAAPVAPTTVAKTEPTSPSPAPRPAAAAARNAGGGWMVQLGLFAKRDNAERLVHAAQAKGFAVSISNADARGLYRVYARGMADRSAAEGYAQRLKDQGLPAAVIAAP